MYVKLECNSIRGDTYAWAIRHWQPHTAPDHYVEDVQSDLHNTNRKSWRGIEKTWLSQQISWRSFIEPYNLVNGFDLLTLVFERTAYQRLNNIFFLFQPRLIFAISRMRWQLEQSASNRCTELAKIKIVAKLEPFSLLNESFLKAPINRKEAPKWSQLSSAWPEYNKYVIDVQEKTSFYERLKTRKLAFFWGH